MNDKEPIGIDICASNAERTGWIDALGWVCRLGGIKRGARAEIGKKIHKLMGSKHSINYLPKRKIRPVIYREE